jgi:hypothetical protein
LFPIPLRLFFLFIVAPLNHAGLHAGLQTFFV